MNGQQIRKALRAGDTVMATLVVSTSPQWLTMIEGIGLDFVFIDTEHIAIDRCTLSWMCRAYAGKGLTPMVRIPSPNPYEACIALDGGAVGIVAPYVETVEQVRDLLGAVKYKPLKGERLQQALDDPNSMEPDLREYLEQKNANHFLVVNIESRPGIENLDAILQVEGLDAVLIGPHDLSCSLGRPEDYSHPDFLAAVDTIISKARAQGKGAGLHSITPELAAREVEWAAKGANLIMHSADILAASEKLGDDIRALRETLGVNTGDDERSAINI